MESLNSFVHEQNLAPLYGFELIFNGGSHLKSIPFCPTTAALTQKHLAMSHTQNLHSLGLELDSFPQELRNLHVFKMCSVECCPRTWSTVRNVTKDSLNCAHAISVGLGSQAPWLKARLLRQPTNQFP